MFPVPTSTDTFHPFGYITREGYRNLNDERRTAIEHGT